VSGLLLRGWGEWGCGFLLDYRDIPTDGCGGFIKGRLSRRL